MIYLHIPFCKQKCSYCNFHFSTNLGGKQEMLAAIKKEIFLRKDELASRSLKTLYFGGGTPSILDGDEIKSLLDEILKYFSFENDIEITLEANPDDLDKNFLQSIKNSGINRLSIGTQSFFDEDLKLMNRAHNSSDAESSIKRAQDFGFGNISIDLIYGSPTSNFEIWKENLNKTIALQVPHVSSYAMTVEPKTALNAWISAGKIKAPRETEQNEEFYFMSDFLKENGFDHYEISNFGKPGFHSKHNTSYWNSCEYLGIGPSAHSYDGAFRRSWNVANNSLYIKSLNQNQLPSDSETLSEKDRLNEIIMTGLRTMWGADFSFIKSNFSDEVLKEFYLLLNKKIEENLIIIKDDKIKIPEEKWFFADGIAADLFLI